jgi:hypothetical protein
LVNWPKEQTAEQQPIEPLLVAEPHALVCFTHDAPRALPPANSIADAHDGDNPSYTTDAPSCRLTSRANRSEISAAGWGEWMRAMKLRTAVLVILALCAGPAFAQQQVGSSTFSSTATIGQQGQSPPLSFPPPSTTIRVIGSPAVQPFRGLGVECTPVQQEIVGVIIGPTDLCER